MSVISLTKDHDYCDVSKDIDDIQTHTKEPLTKEVNFKFAQSGNFIICNYIVEDKSSDSADTKVKVSNFDEDDVKNRDNTEAFSIFEEETKQFDLESQSGSIDMDLIEAAKHDIIIPVGVNNNLNQDDVEMTPLCDETNDKIIPISNNLIQADVEASSIDHNLPAQFPINIESNCVDLALTEASKHDIIIAVNTNNSMSLTEPNLSKNGEDKNVNNSPNRDKEFVCHSCSKKHKSFGSLQRHLRFECTVEPKYKCPLLECKYKAKYVSSVIKHVSAMHPQYDIEEIKEHFS